MRESMFDRRGGRKASNLDKPRSRNNEQKISSDELERAMHDGADQADSTRCKDRSSPERPSKGKDSV